MNKLSKKLLLGLFIVLAIFSVITIKQWLSRNSPVSFEQMDSGLIEEVQQNGEINFNEITDFEWESMFIFQPYTSPEEINHTLQIKWLDVEKTYAIQSNDNLLFVVFMHNKQVTEAYHYPRVYGEIDVTYAHSYPPEEAIFEVK